MSEQFNFLWWQILRSNIFVGLNHRNRAVFYKITYNFKVLKSHENLHGMIRNVHNCHKIIYTNIVHVCIFLMELLS